MLCTRITLTTSRRPSAPPSEGESILASRHTCIHGIAESADASPRDERAAKEEGKGKRRRGKEATLCFPPPPAWACVLQRIRSLARSRGCSYSTRAK